MTARRQWVFDTYQKGLFAGTDEEGDMGLLEALGLKKKAAPPSGKTIKVGPRDTLKSIAKREYGNEDLWTKIFEANKWRIDGDEVVPGQDLFIPDVSS
jgi:nucleoid-associated protein YgaU